MNRLQKKCLIASGLSHGLLILVVLIGSAFSTREKETIPPVVTFLPSAMLTDGASRGGNPQASVPRPEPAVQPPAPAPAPEPDPVPVRRPEPEPPQVVRVPEPQPRPEPTPRTASRPADVPKPTVKSQEPKFDFKKVDPKPTTAKATQERFDFKPVQAPKTTTKPAPRQATPDSRNDAFRELANSLASAKQAISKNTGSTTSIEMPGPGGGGPVMANYAEFVRQRYDQAWLDPEDVSDERAVVKVEIVIERSGNVISARVLSRSGIPALDKSVQGALDRVRHIRPFPAGSTDQQRTFIINFNLKAKRSLG